MNASWPLPWCSRLPGTFVLLGGTFVLLGAIGCQGSAGNLASRDASATGGTISFGGAGGHPASGGAPATGGTPARGGTGGSQDPTSKCASPAALQGAQWTKASWPAENGYAQLVATGDVLLARTWDVANGGRVFLSTDQAASWTQSSAADTDIDILSIVPLSDDSILAATWANHYRSSSGGTSWENVSRPGIPTDTAIRSLVSIDSVLFAGTTGSIYRSSDNGTTWTEVKTGLPTNATVFSMAGRGDTVFAGTDTSGVLVTKNGGATWSTASSGLTVLKISQLALLGSRLFAVTLNGAFFSDDSGASWAPDNSTIQGVNGYLVLNDQLLAGTDANGAYFSNDGGERWNPLGSGLPDGTRIWSLAASRTSLYAATDSGVWRADCNETSMERHGTWLCTTPPAH